MLKKELRKKVLAARDRLSPAEREEKSARIGNRLFLLPELSAARTILFFASFRSEVGTAAMIRRALAEGKRVVLPKVAGERLELHEVRDPERDLAAGAWGIPEPVRSSPVRVDEIDLVVVPGAAFDARGNRLGYGAGFYDKLLPLYKGPTVAPAFEVQIVPSVPADPHDIPVQWIVTESRVIKARA